MNGGRGGGDDDAVCFKSSRQAHKATGALGPRGGEILAMREYRIGV